MQNERTEGRKGEGIEGMHVEGREGEGKEEKGGDPQGLFYTTCSKSCKIPCAFQCAVGNNEIYKLVLKQCAKSHVSSVCRNDC